MIYGGRRVGTRDTYQSVVRLSASAYLVATHANVDVQTLVQLCIYMYSMDFILSLNIDVCMGTKYALALNRTADWYVSRVPTRPY